MNYYNEAKAHYATYLNTESVLDLTKAKEALGKAVHYLADLATPVHTGYTGATTGIANLNRHISFEESAKLRQNIIIANANINYTYNNMHLLSVNDFAEQVAEFSYSHYSTVDAYFTIMYNFVLGVPGVSPELVQNMTTVYYNVIDECLERSLDFIATFLYRFALEVGMLGFLTESNSTGLTVTGTTNYWYFGTLEIPSQINEHVITKIGNSAFAGQSGITSVEIPNTVTIIGQSAFQSTALAAVTFASGSQLEVIGNNAFAGCSALTSVNIPSSVTSIGSNAFHSNTHVVWHGNIEFKNGELLSFIGNPTSYTIPQFITAIDSGALLSANNLTAIHVDSSNQHFSSRDGVLFNRNQTTLIHYPRGRAASDYIIPNTVTHIGANAFANSSIVNITIPSGVVSIGANAFSNVTELQFVTNRSIAPQEIDSTTFAGVDRDNIQVVVPSGTVQKYENMGWTGFNLIESIDGRYNRAGTADFITVYDTALIAYVSDGLLRPLRVGAANSSAPVFLYCVIFGETRAVGQMFIWGGWFNIAFTMDGNQITITLNPEGGTRVFTAVGAIPDGTPLAVCLANNWYEIRTAHQFNDLRTLAGVGWLNANIKLMENIDLTVLGNWVPLPDFRGVLDGNEKTITYQMNVLNHNDNPNSDINFGLFRSISALGMVSNLNINVTVRAIGAQTGTGWINIGGLAGAITNTTDTSRTFVDGVNVNILNKIVFNRVNSRIGGIAGRVAGGSRNRVLIDNCTVSGTLHGDGHMGGIAGVGSSVEIKNSTASWLTVCLELTPGFNRAIGGIIGHGMSSSITGCHVVVMDLVRFAGVSIPHDARPMMGYIAGWLQSGDFSGCTGVGFAINPNGLSQVQSEFVVQGGVWREYGRNS
jgi:hypothetical protein